MQIGSTVALFCSVSLLFLGSGCDRQEPSVPPSAPPPLPGKVIVTADPDGDEPGGEKQLTVDCEDSRDFCWMLIEPGNEIQPVKPIQACTMVYGGPETASIVGEVDGEKINLSFSRNNGCQIARYDQLAEGLSWVPGGEKLGVSAEGAV